MNIKGQGHSLAVVQDHSDSTFSNFFSLETARPIGAKFHVEPPWDSGTKVCSNGPGHMTKWLPSSYMVKTLKNLLWNRKACYLETWYAALGTRVLPSMFRPIFRQGQSWSLMLLYGKKVKQWISQKLL